MNPYEPTPDSKPKAITSSPRICLRFSERISALPVLLLAGLAASLCCFLWLPNQVKPESTSRELFIPYVIAGLLPIQFLQLTGAWTLRNGRCNWVSWLAAFTASLPGLTPFGLLGLPFGWCMFVAQFRYELRIGR